MLWIRNFLKTGFGTFCLVFVPALLFCFFLDTSNTFATSVTCTADISGYHSFSSSEVFYDFYSDQNCDLSSLNVNSTFYYKYDFHSVDPSGATNTSGLLCFSTSSVSCSGSGFPNFYKIGLDSVGWYFFSHDFSFFFDDSTLTSRQSNLFWRYFVVSIYAQRYSVTLGDGSTLTLTVSDVSPFSDCPESPSGSISLTENGTFDVSSYATAVVDVPPVMGDYHDDLLSIKQSIYTCGAICLVLYFFYCIYRMIIKSTGGF